MNAKGLIDWLLNISGMKDAVYQEWVPTGAFVKATILIVASSIVFLLLTLAVFLRPIDTEAVIGFGVSITTLVFILILLLNFRGITIQVSSERLTVDYGLLNHKSIRLDEIVTCKIVKASFRRFGGVGVRYGLDGSWAYTTSFGNAVEIVPTKGRTFVFSSSNPERICQLINQKKLETTTEQVTDAHAQCGEAKPKSTSVRSFC
ncbi:MAG: hypothetical protein O2U62_02195 [Candidatus Bathyarchaeota archaeon]|nr:hypothetical protein [Candidatus Bathyarchaeota archaeon]